MYICAVMAMNAAVRDPEGAKRLGEISEQLSGVGVVVGIILTATYFYFHF